MDLKELARFLKKSGVGEAAEYLKSHPALAPFLADPSQPLDTKTCERQTPPIRFLGSLGG